MSNIDFSYINDNGRKISGTAAQLHVIKQMGGIDNYNEEVSAATIRSLIKDNKISINNEIQKNISRSRFHVVNE